MSYMPRPSEERSLPQMNQSDHGAPPPSNSDVNSLSSQTQEPSGSRDQAPAEAQTTATEMWAAKWLTFCRAYGIDPARSVNDVIARFDHTGEERERIARGLR